MSENTDYIKEAITKQKEAGFIYKKCPLKGCINYDPSPEYLLWCGKDCIRSAHFDPGIGGGVPPKDYTDCMDRTIKQRVFDSLVELKKGTTKDIASRAKTTDKKAYYYLTTFSNMGLTGRIKVKGSKAIWILKGELK